MTPTQLIEADARKRGIDAKKVLASVNARVKSKEAFLLQEGDTLLVARKLAPTAVELHLFTEDSPIKLSKNLVRLLATGRRIGVKKIYGKADNPQILQMLKSIGADVQDSDNDAYNWMATI